MIKLACTQQQYPWILITGLVPGVSYHWQVNEEASSGSIASYVGFADGGASFSVTGLGPPFDAGPALDAGSTIDAGSVVDSGSMPDAGLPSDAGEPADAGEPSDA